MRKKVVFNRWVICIAVVALLCISFIGCSNGREDSYVNQRGDQIEIIPSDKPICPDDEGSYSIVKRGEKCYIIFENPAQYDNGDKNELATLEFTSIKDFVDSVTNGELKEWQKNVVATAFPKNEYGILSCDFTNLFEPIAPTGTTLRSVVWRGESYSFSLTNENGVFGTVHYFTKDEYSEVFTSDYEAYFDKDAITVSKTETQEGGVTITYYATRAGQFMQVRYTLTEDSKIMHVDETYRLHMNDSSVNVSDTVPANVTLYCLEGDVCYVVDLFGFADDPSDAWLLSFGLVQYKEKDIVSH